MKYADLNFQKDSSLREKPKGKGGILVFLAILFVGGLIAYIFKDKIKNSFNPISVVASVTAADLKETDGRTNILILGYDKRSKGSEGSELTDTLLVASIGKIDNDVVLISIPRDLWINQYHSKINAIYTVYGMDSLKQTINDVLGISIHYHVLVTFDLFQKIIDVLGGVDIQVDSAFTDMQYPVEGKENAPENERYQTVSFQQGMQHMGGDLALKFARSRHGDNNEGTDFARAKRQQKIILAVKDKALSASTLLNPSKVKELYNTYAQNVDTNVDFPTAQAFYLLSQKINFSKAISIVLDDRSAAEEGGLLYAPTDTTLYSGQYVLLPQTGNFDQIHAYVQKYLFGNK